MAVPRSIAGCGKAIGEVAHSDGGVENNITLGCLYRIFNPLARGHSPYIPLRKHRGRGLKVVFLVLTKGRFYIFPLFFTPPAYGHLPYRTYVRRGGG